MTEAVRRTFRVGVPLAEAWARFGEVERWPEWAPHITAVTLRPPGPLGPSSSGTLRIRGLGRSAFQMTIWDPPRRWVWVGGLPGTRITYDHRFEPEGDTAATLVWVVSLQGPLALLVRPVFAWIYGRNVDRAIPRLQTWIARGPWPADPDRASGSGQP